MPRGTNDIIAAMVEPIHGTTCEIPRPGYLEDFTDLCRKNDILSIFDEVKGGHGAKRPVLRVSAR